MAWSTLRTPNRSPIFQRFLAISCIIIFIPLTIAALIVLGLIPVYLTNRSVRTTRTNIGVPFNVSYVLVDQSTRSNDGINLNSMDSMKIAREFERALGLSVLNTVGVRGITRDMAMNEQSSSRRKRLIQCDRNLRGPILAFEFNLNYPIARPCQTQKCIDRVFDDIYQKFQTVLSLFVDLGNGLRELRLCSFNIKPLQTTQSTVTSTQLSTISSSSNQGLNSSVSTNLSSTSISSTVTGISSNGTSSGPIFSTTEIVNSNSTTNGSSVGLDVCLLKIPFIQESIPPYRITHTSTLYFQSENSLIVAGASKFEISLDTGTSKQEIKINGIIVYTNCQRTIDISVPTYCYYPISS